MVTTGHVQGSLFT